jgi:hypothetical protein
MKLHCISASVITALLMAISVFVANVSHTEYKSQMRKRKIKKTEQTSLEQVIPDKLIQDNDVAIEQ